MSGEREVPAGMEEQNDAAEVVHDEGAPAGQDDLCGAVSPSHKFVSDSDFCCFFKRLSNISLVWFSSDLRIKPVLKRCFQFFRLSSRRCCCAKTSNAINRRE